MNLDVWWKLCVFPQLTEVATVRETIRPMFNVVCNPVIGLVERQVKELAKRQYTPKVSPCQ